MMAISKHQIKEQDQTKTGDIRCVGLLPRAASVDWELQDVTQT